MKFIIISLLLSSLSFAATINQIKLKGTLVGFDETRIYLKTSSDKIVYFPKAAYPEVNTLQTGKSIIQVETSIGEFLELNPIQKTKR